MNERDKTAHMMQESSGQLLWGTESHFQQFADLIRADTMETATRAANQSWMLLAKSMIAAEREACADIAENWNSNGSPRVGVAAQIRARGNT